MGKAVLAEARPSFTPGRTGRIVNLVTFFNELDLLRLHFEEMAPWVDAFVVVEASSSFTGHEKPLHFEANRALFKDFEHKIVHVPIWAFPEHLASPWAREFYQRDMAIAGASGLCGEEDYILETDVDELIDGRVLDGFEADFASLDLRLSRFFLNYRPSVGNPSRTQMKSSIFKARYRQRYGVSYSRIVLGGWDRRSHVLRDAGWHFTSMMEADAISLKVHSYSHQEQTKEKYRSVDHFERTLERIREGDLDPGWERVDLDDSFPASVRRNPEAFAKVLLQPPSDRRLAS
jgi:beta-1,4-mannosyl-glycoprotein beta-1,4-N-acetylglucosaminyltransferase